MRNSTAFDCHVFVSSEDRWFMVFDVMRMISTQIRRQDPCWSLPSCENIVWNVWEVAPPPTPGPRRSRTLHGSNVSQIMGAIHSAKISGNFGPKLNGSVRSNRKSFEKTGPPFEVDHFSRSDRLENLDEWTAPLNWETDALQILFDST